MKSEVKWKRWEQITLVLREFESYLSDRVPHPFQIIQADDSLWTPQERKERTPVGYSNRLTGVYFYFDCCVETDIHQRPDGQFHRYSVLRKLGSATNNFEDRVRKAHWTDKGKRLRFTHRWIDIIPVPKELGFITLAMEDFFLQRIRSEVDSRRVSPTLRKIMPTIYDEGISQAGELG